MSENNGQPQNENELDVLRLIIAFFLPPVGVWLQEGFKPAFWINILLCLFGYLPGILHAFYIILSR